MMRLAVLLSCLALPAVAQDETAMAAMTTAIEEAGCIVTAENGDAVLAASGLNEADTMAVIAKLYEDGLVALTEDGNMVILTEACQ